MGQVLRGKNLWENLKGKKDEIKESIAVNFGGVEGEITVQFVDVDIVQEIIEQFDELKPKKPNILIKLNDGRSMNIEVPNGDEKYKAFNSKPEAKEKIKKWEEKSKPIEEKKKLRLAYEFIIPEERPGKTVEEGIEILKSTLRFMDVINIVNKGFELNSLGGQLKKPENDF
ncbi:hypothetical protein D7D81_02545 [Halocella sp. SP3-1]|nr:hypothetical protein D7D81_02545 [Halocella sp. SP3-1]